MSRSELVEPCGTPADVVQHHRVLDQLEMVFHRGLVPRGLPVLPRKFPRVVGIREPPPGKVSRRASLLC